MDRQGDEANPLLTEINAEALGEHDDQQRSTELLEAPYSSPQQRRRERLRTAVVALLAIGCLVGMGWAFTLHEGAKGPDDLAVEQLTPPPGSEVVPAQTPIIVDMAFGYQIELTLDGKIIPDSEVDVVEATNLYTYRAQADGNIESLTPGTHIVQLVYWPITGERVRDGNVFQWSFRVV